MSLPVSMCSATCQYVDDLGSQIEKLKVAGARVRNEVEVGPGGEQIQIEDPDGNPIELHEAPTGPEVKRSTIA